MRIALAQINTTVGDVDGNAAKVAEWIERARQENCDLVVFPELTLSGYPAQDLYLQPHFGKATERALAELAADIDGIAALVGFVEPVADLGRGSTTGPRDRPNAHNSLALLSNGRIEAIHRKQVLPTYGVFDEVRHFLPGGDPVVTSATSQVPGIGLTICEDCWEDGELAQAEVGVGARLLINSAASPWYRGRGPEREAVFSDLARSLRRPFAVCNLVGAQDGLVFDGASFVVSPEGEVLARAARFAEDLLICEPDGTGSGLATPAADDLKEVRQGLITGLRDYVQKNGFTGVVLGLSGGIDSALVATLATEALGPEQVTCIVMPSPHSSEETQRDARDLASNLGARLLEMPIEPTMEAYDAVLEPATARPEGDSGLMRENIQARIRGNLVMAISNREGLLPLSCGNKSEAAVGYATLYGDMAGGFAPIKDVPKTLVYELAEDFNRTGIGIASEPARSPIPRSVIERAPTAELRPGQFDTDSLPDYPILDRALEAHLERDLSRDEMVGEGIDRELAERVIALVRGSEYKRRQGAPGTRITRKDLDRDRRMPVTNRYRSDGP